MISLKKREPFYIKLSLELLVTNQTSVLLFYNRKSTNMLNRTLAVCCAKEDSSVRRRLALAVCCTTKGRVAVCCMKKARNVVCEEDLQCIVHCTVREGWQ